MTTETNPYEGVSYFTYPINKYAATATRGTRTRVIGYYDTLQEAIDARDARQAALTNHTSLTEEATA